MEALETIVLAEDMTLSPEMRTRLIQFLKENLDVFAWSHEDMLSISL